MRADNMTRLTPTTGSSPVSSNGDGMNAWRRLPGLRSRSGACRTSSHGYCATTSVRRCWRSPMTCPGYGTHLAASSETRKRILRTVLKKIIVTVEASRLRLVLHWQGGDHTRLEVAKKPYWPKSLENRCRDRLAEFGEGFVGRMRTKRRRIDSVSAVPRRTAVTYLTI